MSEQGTTKDQLEFKRVDSVWIDGSICENSQHDCQYIHVGEMTLDVGEAKRLVEWLKKALS